MTLWKPWMKRWERTMRSWQVLPRKKIWRRRRFRVWKKRLPWLIILLLFWEWWYLRLLEFFETVVAVIPIVMCFQSLILDMAGNVGTQSLAVTIRVLMDENLNRKDKFGLILKEMRIGFANGLFLGIMAFVFIGLYVCFIKEMRFPIRFFDLRLCGSFLNACDGDLEPCRNNDPTAFP